MRRRTAAGAVSALLLVGCGSVRDTQQADPNAVAAGSAQSGHDPSDQNGPRGCPSESWPGPWSECAEADWVRKVVRQAGYTTGSDTGSALVASTDETSFYIWTTAGTTENLQRGLGRRLATIAETPVYGDDEPWTVDENGLPTAAGWRIWSAQGFIFWTTAGPSAADGPLSFTALEPLIEASKEVPSPP